MAIKIFIDQGHNPVNPNAGAEGNGYREQDITYDVGTRLAALLRGDPEFSVRLSRTAPSQVLGQNNTQSLAARVDAANAWDADYFISLHTNAASSPGANGSEGLVYSLDGEAANFAFYLVRGLVDATGFTYRGIIARPGLYVLRKTRMPAVLVEMGFITNPGDARVMGERPELVARGLYNGIVKYFGLG